MSGRMARWVGLRLCTRVDGARVYEPPRFVFSKNGQPAWWTASLDQVFPDAVACFENQSRSRVDALVFSETQVAVLTETGIREAVALTDLIALGPLTKEPSPDKHARMLLRAGGELLLPVYATRAGAFELSVFLNGLPPLA
jgi:hypothetical protein